MKKMNTVSKSLTLIAVAFALGMSVNNFALSKVPANFSVAVVDVQKVVASSPQVDALKTQQKKNFSELAKFVEGAKADLAKEKDATKKKALEEKYGKELNDRKSTIERDYAQKLADIDKSISETIKTKAAKDGYDLVLTKNVVLVGGKDITDEIAKSLK